MWLEVRKGLCERARDEETDEGREREREREWLTIEDMHKRLEIEFIPPPIL